MALLGALRSVVAHERTLAATAHRVTPPPERSWVMAQTWRALLFAHWPVEPAALRRLVPAPLELDTFDGAAWLAVTPFRVTDARLRFTLPVPWLSAFPEINVRTYVRFRGAAGIWFLSLDTSNRPAVAAARRAYRLPYFPARMEVRRDGACVDYRSERVQANAPPARFEARYEPAGPVFHAREGTLEHFLTERYRLFTLDAAGRPLTGEIHHPPWPLQPARAEIAGNTMGAEAGLDLTGEPLLHHAARQDVVFWPLQSA